MRNLNRERGSAKLILIIIGLVAALGATGYFAWGFRTKKIAAEKDLRAALRDKSAMASDLEKEKTRASELDLSVGARTKERDDALAKATTDAKTNESLQANLKASKAELDELRTARAEAEKRIASFKELTSKFQKMIDTGKINVQVRDGRMLMKLPAGILFDSGSAELSKEGQMAIMEVAVILKDFKDRNFMVAGHTDNVAPAKGAKYKSNWELSTARAVTVTEFLISAGMKPTALVAAGYGEHDPVSKSNKAENRRIEIVLLPRIEELPAMPPEMTEAKNEK